jgi:PEP-CTERM motif-containing protein
MFLDGSLQLALLNGFVPSATENFTILSAIGNIFGAFANVANGQRLATSDGLGSFVVHYGPGSAFNTKLVVLSAFQAVLPGDYNQNGTVDAADYTVWRNHLGQPFTLTNENPAAATPGVVDAEDYVFWKSRFGDSLGSGSGAAATAIVPEPTTLVLLMLVATGWCVRRSRDA